MDQTSPDVSCAQKAARLAHEGAVFGNDRGLIAARRVEVMQHSRTLGPSNPLAAQVFEQGFAMDEAQRGVPQRCGLGAQHPVVGDLAHETGVFVFPQLPGLRTLRQPMRYPLLIAIVTAQRSFDPIRGFTHEP